MLALGIAVTQAQANDALWMATEKYWQAFRVEEDRGRTCFVSSVPTESKGNYTKRGEILAQVFHMPSEKERNVVMFRAGYKFKKQSDVEVNIDGKTFRLFTIEDRAYAESEEDDIAIIQSMKRGRRMTVTGTSSRGTETTDIYSLSGFTKAKNLIDRTCK